MTPYARLFGQTGPTLALAPMEGFLDATGRNLLCALGGIDFCVSEFVRVVKRPVPKRVLLRSCPELNTDGCAAGVPLVVQLLGGEPEPLAGTAALACELGALGIDLNFGCPARKVNGSDGGAALLKTPGRIRQLVEAVRDRCDKAVPVSAKMRLGWSDPDEVAALVTAAADGGADFITLHGRTRHQLFRGEADWERIGSAAQQVSVPLVANGDIFSVVQFERCLATTDCQAFMIGRGVLRDPNLFRLIRRLDSAPWTDRRCLRFLLDLIEQLLAASIKDPPRVALNRTKAWMGVMREAHPTLESSWDRVKRCERVEQAQQILREGF